MGEESQVSEGTGGWKQQDAREARRSLGWVRW